MLVITKLILRTMLNAYNIAMQCYNIKNDSYHTIGTTSPRVKLKNRYSKEVLMLML